MSPCRLPKPAAGNPPIIPATAKPRGKSPSRSSPRSSTIPISSCLPAPAPACSASTIPGYSIAETEPSWHARATAFAGRVYELTSFLSDILRVDFTGRAYPRRVTYHNSCSSFREMGVATQPRKLLQSLDGIAFVEMNDREVCCGFGGTFSIKYPDISNAMVSQKVDRIAETKADVLTGADLGCLMNIAGKLAREGKAVEVRHIAEILAGELEEPGLCAPE